MNQGISCMLTHNANIRTRIIKMQVKRISFCPECSDVVNEEIVSYNESKFLQKVKELPDDYTLENGPNFDGTVLMHNRYCNKCR